MQGKDWQADIALLHERDMKARRILGVADAAGPAGIRKAFRRLSLRFHPDAGGGREDAPGRFHLICCAYKYLTEGEWCSALDNWDGRRDTPTRGKYRLDNPWGYWCWWREQYFDGHQREKRDADLRVPM